MNIVLTTYPSKKEYNYKTKQEALNDIKDSGLTKHQYQLLDKANNTIYKGGLWLTPKEYKLLEDGFSIKLIKLLRRKGGVK